MATLRIVILRKCTRLAFCCHSEYLYDFSTGNLSFCMNLLIAPVMVGLMQSTLFAGCVNLYSNFSLAVGKIALSIPLIGL